MASDTQPARKPNMFEDGRFGLIAIMTTPLTVLLVVLMLAL